MHLRMCLYKTNKHPQQLMRDLGITYDHATPQSMFDAWWFWNCKNLPPQLPDCLSELKIKANDAIGHGLSKEDAVKISMNESVGG